MALSTVVAQDVEWPPARHENAMGKLLTAREAEIARLVAAGLSNKQIAQRASISEGTVKTHLHSAYQKFGIANRAALALWSVQAHARGAKKSHKLPPGKLTG